MKKILLVLLLCVCFIFTGCTSLGGVGLKQNSDGTIVEYFFIPFNSQEMVTYTDITTAEILQIRTNIRVACDNLMKSYIDEYKARIDASEDYTDEQKEILKEHGVLFDSNFNNKTEYLHGFESSNYIIYELFFANKLCYLEFKGANPELQEQKETVTESNFFTTTTKTIKDPIFDNTVISTITLGKYFTEACKEQMINVIGQARWNINKQILKFDECSELYAYCYVVPTARLHSNADEVVCLEGYYYHIWQVPANNLSLPDGERVVFEYWTTIANKHVWYILALIIAGAIIAGTIIYAKQKEKKEVEELTQILDINEKVDKKD